MGKIEKYGIVCKKKLTTPLKSVESNPSIHTAHIVSVVGVWVSALAGLQFVHLENMSWKSTDKAIIYICGAKKKRQNSVRWSGVEWSGKYANER